MEEESDLEKGRKVESDLEVLEEGREEEEEEEELALEDGKA